MSYIVIDWFNEENPFISTDEHGNTEKLNTLQEAKDYSVDLQDPQIVNCCATSALFSEEDMLDFGNLIEERQKYSAESIGELFKYYMNTKFKKKYE